MNWLVLSNSQRLGYVETFRSNPSFLLEIIRARIEPSKLISILEVEDLWDGMVSVRFCSFGINRTRWGYRYTAIFLREIG